MKWLKRLFCRHEWKYDKNIILIEGGLREKYATVIAKQYKCAKCGKVRKVI